MLLADLHRILTSISGFLRPVLDLDLAATLLVTDLKQTSNSIFKAQVRRWDSLNFYAKFEYQVHRQKDVWALVSTAVKQSKSKSASASLSPTLKSEIVGQMETSNKIVKVMHAMYLRGEIKVVTRIWFCCRKI